MFREGVGSISDRVRRFTRSYDLHETTKMYGGLGWQQFGEQERLFRHTPHLMKVST